MSKTEAKKIAQAVEDVSLEVFSKRMRAESHILAIDPLGAALLGLDTSRYTVIRGVHGEPTCVRNGPVPGTDFQGFPFPPELVL